MGYRNEEWAENDISSYDFGWPAAVEASKGLLDPNTAEDTASVWVKHYTHIPTGFQAVFVAVTPYFILVSGEENPWEKLSKKIGDHLGDAMGLMFDAFDKPGSGKPDVFTRSYNRPLRGVTGCMGDMVVACGRQKEDRRTSRIRH